MLSGFFVTKKGKNLLTKTHDGANIELTRAEIGSGDIPEGQLVTEVTSLYGKVKELPLGEVKVGSGKEVCIPVQLTNKGVLTSFLFKEIGVYAIDPDEGEILYLYGNTDVTGDVPDEVKSESESQVDYLFNLLLNIDNTTKVDVNVDNSLIYATLQNLSDMADTKVDKVSGKGLSTEDYTTAEKNKLAGIAAGANNYTHPSTHPASMITGLPTSLPANGGTANKVANKLTAGSKTYDGSAAVTITAADLGAITSIPVEYVTETEYATASKGGVVKSSTAADKVSVGTDGTMSLNTVSGSKVSGAVASATSATTATKLSTSAGSATQPVYFSSGKPVATTYTLGASVPSGAKFTDTTYSTATTSAAGLMSATDKTKLEATNIAYGTCATAAATAAKVVTLSGNTNWKLVPGSTVTVKFTYTNTASNPTLNVAGTGAKPIWVNTAVITTSNLAYAGSASRPIKYVYNGTQYVCMGWSGDNNSTYALMTAAEATTGTATNAKLISAKVLHDKIEEMLPTLSSLGVTATAAEINYIDGVTSNIQTQLNGKAAASHTHSAATTSAAGFMSAADKTKLNGISAGATNYESQLKWGNTNISGGLSPIDVAASSLHSANGLQFAKPAGITIEYSRDGGTTWVDYGATDVQKIALVSGLGSVLNIGGHTSGVTVNDKLRVTLDATAMGVYTKCQKILLNVSTSGASGSNVIVEKAMKGSTTTFTNVTSSALSGFSGWNSLYVPCSFGGDNTQTGNVAKLRFTFGITGLHPNTSYNNAFNLIDMVMISETYWRYPSNMAKTGHIYSWDTAQNATFPAALSASSVYDNGQRVYSPSNKPTSADITGLGTAATKNTGTAAGNVPVLGSDGKLPEAILPESLSGGATGQTWHAKDILGSGTTSTADATAESGYSVTIDTTAKNLNGSAKKYKAPFGTYVAIFRVQASTVTGSADKIKLEIWGTSAAIASRAVKLSDFSVASKWEYFKIPFETDSTSGRDIYPKVTCLNATGNVKVDNIVVVPNAFALM